MPRFAFVLKQFRLKDEGLKPRRGQSNHIETIIPACIDWNPSPMPRPPSRGLDGQGARAPSRSRIRSGTSAHESPSMEFGISSATGSHSCGSWVWASRIGLKNLAYNMRRLVFLKRLAAPT